MPTRQLSDEQRQRYANFAAAPSPDQLAQYFHNDDIAHLSPLIWRHLNFLGRYDFSLPDTVMNGGLRPLRNPTSAWDF